jgi:hypothetical protein
MIQPKPGQVWRDTVNRDLLLVKEVDPEWPIGPPSSPGMQPGPRYARCLAFCATGSWETKPCAQFMGTQEMQFKHFNSGRFIKVGPLSSLYYRWRMRTWAKQGGL